MKVNHVYPKKINLIKPFIFTKKVKNKKVNQIIPLSIKTKNIGPIRHYPPATKEWFNSVYAFNKNYIKNLSLADNNMSNIIKSYFNFYFSRNVLKGKNISIRFRRLGIKKIFLSKAEIKHTNKKVIITLYVYNEEKRILVRKIERLEKLLFPSKLYQIKNRPLSIFEKLNLIKEEKTLFTVKLNKLLLLTIKQIIVYKNRTFFKNSLNNLFLILKLKKYLKIIINILKNSEKNTTYSEYYDKVYYEAKYNKYLEKEIKKMAYYRLLLNLNKAKFEERFILKLKPLIRKIYNKEVEFNIVNLKSIMLDSNIFTQIIALKIKNRKNKLLRVLSRSLTKVRLPLRIIPREKYININRNEWYINRSKYDQILNLILKKKLDNLFQKFDASKDNLNQILYLFDNLNLFFTPDSFKIGSKQRLLNLILNSIKYKKIAGVRLEAKGRLTRRLTASRSVFKIRWKGSLKNWDSSFRGLSSVILRGHIKSNVQYSVINSKTRNGAFGLKGWISGK